MFARSRHMSQSAPAQTLQCPGCCHHYRWLGDDIFESGSNIQITSSLLSRAEQAVSGHVSSVDCPSAQNRIYWPAARLVWPTHIKTVNMRENTTNAGQWLLTVCVSVVSCQSQHVSVCGVSVVVQVCSTGLIHNIPSTDVTKKWNTNTNRHSTKLRTNPFLHRKHKQLPMNIKVVSSQKCSRNILGSTSRVGHVGTGV